jgi:hypothetical protein
MSILFRREIGIFGNRPKKVRDLAWVIKRGRQFVIPVTNDYVREIEKLRPTSQKNIRKCQKNQQPHQYKTKMSQKAREYFGINQDIFSSDSALPNEKPQSLSISACLENRQSRAKKRRDDLIVNGPALRPPKILLLKKPHKIFDKNFYVQHFSALTDDELPGLVFLFQISVG